MCGGLMQYPLVRMRVILDACSGFWQPIDLQETKISPTLPTAYDTLLADYLKSLPTNQQRLLHHYEQDATDVEIWNAFRSRQRLTIASDGSLLTTAGTFGWKLTTAKHATLFLDRARSMDP